MAELTCGNCGKPISASDVLCPHCQVVLAAYASPTGSVSAEVPDYARPPATSAAMPWDTPAAVNPAPESGTSPLKLDPPATPDNTAIIAPEPAPLTAADNPLSPMEQLDRQRDGIEERLSDNETRLNPLTPRPFNPPITRTGEIAQATAEEIEALPDELGAGLNVPDADESRGGRPSTAPTSTDLDESRKRLTHTISADTANAQQDLVNVLNARVVDSQPAPITPTSGRTGRPGSAAEEPTNWQEITDPQDRLREFRRQHRQTSAAADPEPAKTATVGKPAHQPIIGYGGCLAIVAVFGVIALFTRSWGTVIVCILAYIVINYMSKNGYTISNRGITRD